MRTIEVTVDPKGGTRVETKGFAGLACRDASRAFEQALGVRTAERLTSEYHAAGTEVRADLEQSG